MKNSAKILHVESFAPQVAKGCRLLVLGTAPSVKSLELQQSYAHPQNLFWPLMGEMFNAGPELPYAERIARLQRMGVGIWDVLESCERQGSLDSAIVRSSEVANDIPGLLMARPSITGIALNGGRARTSFRRLILPRLDVAARERVTLFELPSTSPANAGMTRAEKRRRWQALEEFLT
ncbi:DNA-deoxyinosine glycosylase [Dokdonella sp.]|uniref:DNA-deoxyinosine glycosylase n=1 Tax=Dokdonella sp. TaxID=2291710 RepID=UPI00352997C5